MSIERIHLSKLLRLIYASSSLRRSLLRDDIRSELRSDSDQTGGGDFFAPFWSDAKGHVRGTLDLRTEIQSRVASNTRRARLYPRLSDGFLTWWNERRRWRNEPFQFIEESANGRVQVPELNATIKIENTLGLRLDSRSNRIIYPYFSEEPPLDNDSARLGLWVLHQGLPNYGLNELRILDVLRSTSYAPEDVPFVGNEDELLFEQFELLLAEWARLREEYD